MKQPPVVTQGRKKELFMRYGTYIITIFATLAYTLGAYAGAGSSGGGDASGDRIPTIESWFDGGSSDISRDLVNIATFINAFSSTGQISTEVKDLISKGLIDDIKLGQYDLKSICLDENGVERSASTPKVDLYTNPNQPRPHICINERKLAAENASRDEVVALMFHEHARHFGLDDTVNDDFYPIAAMILKGLSTGLDVAASEFTRNIHSYNLLNGSVAFNKVSDSRFAVVTTDINTKYRVNEFLKCGGVTGTVGPQNSKIKANVPYPVVNNFPYPIFSFIQLKTSGSALFGMNFKSCSVLLGIESNGQTVTLPEPLHLSYYLSGSSGAFNSAALTVYSTDLTDPTMPGAPSSASQPSAPISGPTAGGDKSLLTISLNDPNGQFKFIKRLGIYYVDGDNVRIPIDVSKGTVQIQVPKAKQPWLQYALGAETQIDSVRLLISVDNFNTGTSLDTTCSQSGLGQPCFNSGFEQLYQTSD